MTGLAVGGTPSSGFGASLPRFRPLHHGVLGVHGAARRLRSLDHLPQLRDLLLERRHLLVAARGLLPLLPHPCESTLREVHEFALLEEDLLRLDAAELRLAQGTPVSSSVPQMLQLLDVRAAHLALAHGLHHIVGETLRTKPRAEGLRFLRFRRFDGLPCHAALRAVVRLEAMGGLREEHERAVLRALAPSCAVPRGLRGARRDGLPVNRRRG